MKFKENTSLTSLLTLKVADAVGDLYYPESIDDMIQFTDQEVEFLVLSGGSNICAGKIEQPVIYMGKPIGQSETRDLDDSHVIVHMPSGVAVNSLLNYCIANGFTGLEFMAGIPGTIGGAICGNAAPRGDSWDGKVESMVYCCDGEITKENPLFAYRSLENKPELPFILVSVELKLQKSDSITVRRNVMEYLAKRIRIPFPTAGSLFKNPGELAAGKLLEDAGMKGYSVGDAALFEEHANMIINKGTATFDQFLSLRNKAIEEVYTTFAVLLDSEVQFLQ